MLNNPNRQAVEALCNSDPVLVDIKEAGEVLENFSKTTFLHAGPPIEFQNMCEPMKGAVYCAILNEGLASDIEEAKKLAASGQITYRPCHDFGVVGPMTGLTTYSMPVWVVEDRNTKRRSFANISEGQGVGLRFGEYSQKTLDRLNWIRDIFAPAMKKVIDMMGGIDLAPIMGQGLAMGDELHMRNHATTSLILKAIANYIPLCDSENASDILKFISVGNDQFFLNLAMASAKLAADSAVGFKGSSIVTTIARNGVEVGIKISGLPGRWFTAKAPMVKGLYFPGYSQKDANPDLGDSAIMEVLGFGGSAMVTAPAIIKFLGATNTEFAKKTTEEMYEITSAEHPKYQIPILNFRGLPCGIDIIKVVETSITPVLNTAIASNKPGVGMVGAGMSTLPIEPFVEALKALAEDLGYKGE